MLAGSVVNLKAEGKFLRFLSRYGVSLLWPNYQDDISFDIVKFVVQLLDSIGMIELCEYNKVLVT